MGLNPNARLGPYEIVAPLGAGGMGEVYRAKDTRLDREVAIKVLPERLANDADALARFGREAKAVAALSHPNILAIYDVGSHNKVSYVVTELLEGETLRERLRRSAIPWRKAVEHGIAIADGLAAAHAKGIIHRDLKPENIFLTQEGVVKILDFGLARVAPGAAVSAELQANTPTMTLDTRPGTVLGTVNYMSPEQISGRMTDARTDIFSFGCVLYEMISGRRAFGGESVAEITTAILRDEPPTLADSGRVVPVELDRVIMRCHEKKPEQRIQSARDLSFALRDLLSDTVLSKGRSNAAERRTRTSPAARLALGIVAVAALLLTLNVGGWRERLFSRPQVGAISSIAVLPMENVSRDPEQEYFVDGMTEALISDMAKIGGLKVISRTSVMRYKATTKSLPEIAKELKVDAVVEGSVLRVGDRVRITAQLIHAATDEHLWAESYDRDLRDVLSLHGELARTIAQEIKVTLTPQEQARMAGRRPVNPEAHQAYLKGRFYWNKRTPDGVEKAVAYLEQSVALAPDWAQGYSGLADAYVVIPQYGSMRPHEAMPRAKTAAAKALELDESLGEAHATLALIAEDYDWDFPTAEREFRRALALNPNYATAHHWYALYLLHTGRHDEAVKEMKKAQELDPLSLIISCVLGMTQWSSGRLDEAEIGLRKTLELGPDFPLAHGNLAMTLFLQGRTAEAIAAEREAARLSNNALNQIAILGYMCAKNGQSEEARRILDELTSRSAESYVAPTYFVRVYAGLGEIDQVFNWLEKAYQERDAWLLNVLIEPFQADLRGDPRFADLVRRVGLPPLAPMRSSDPPESPLVKGGGRGASPLDKGDPPLSPLIKGGGGKIMLAVLPFENLSRDPEQDYFSDGMTEELISQLGQINPEKLEVIARTSAMRYKKTDKGVDQIGRELKVDYVVEGSVRRADDRIRITTQLVQVDRQTRLWGDTFNRDLKDVLALQSDVAKAVAREINVKLNPREEARLAATPPVIPAAHDANMRGRFHWHTRTRPGMQKAIEYFRRAIDLDPQYAPAYAGMADAHTHLARHGHVSPKEAFALAKQAALKAVELDDALAEAHGALAVTALYFDWDWTAAEHELRRALNLNESYEEAHHQYSHLLLTVGKPDESLTESRRALELNPLDLSLKFHLGWHYMMTRRYDQAIAQLKSVLEMDPNLYQALRHIGWAYLYDSLHAEAITALETATKLEPDNAQAMSALAAAYAAGGRGSEARALLQQLEGWLPLRYVSACDLAAAYAALNKIDVAFDWLEKAYDERSPRMIELGLDPVFDPLRSDPRFADLLRRVGLPALMSH